MPDASPPTDRVAPDVPRPSLRRFGVLVFSLNTILLALAVVLGVATDDVGEHFGEGDFVTIFSTAQLVALSVIAYRIFRSRPKRSVNQSFLSGRTIWALASFGFFFLAADEQFQIHEDLDERIHEVFAIEETGWTDRIDDLLVGSYGIAGVLALVLCRAELFRFNFVLPWIVAGFGALFAMVFADLMTNRPDVLSTILEDPTNFLRWLMVVEESLKLYGECFFIVGFYGIFGAAREIARQSTG